MQDEYLSVKETAKRIGKHENTIYNMIDDGRLKASKTSDGKYQILSKDIYLFEQEKYIKDNIREIESSSETFINKIDFEIAKKADELFKSMYEEISSYLNSDEYKELVKIDKVLKNTSNSDKKTKLSNRRKVICKELSSKQIKMFNRLYYDIDKYYGLCDLKDNILNFEENIKTNYTSILSDIEDIEEDKWRERW